MIAAGFSASDKQLKQFAWAAPIGFGLIGWLVHRFGAPQWTIWVGLGVGLVVLVAGLASPRSIRLPYAGLMTLAAPIGWAVSNLFIGIFYYLLLTPLALVFRLIGRDPLRMRESSGTSAYDKRGPRGDAASYYRQG